MSKQDIEQFLKKLEGKKIGDGIAAFEEQLGIELLNEDNSHYGVLWFDVVVHDDGKPGYVLRV